jgi:hypothetical protein
MCFLFIAAPGQNKRHNMQTKCGNRTISRHGPGAALCRLFNSLSRTVLFHAIRRTGLRVSS